MSVEVVTTSHIHLRCDAVECRRKYGELDAWPEDPVALTGLAGAARIDGWKVTIRNEGLKGWSAMSFCPDHGEEPS